MSGKRELSLYFHIPFCTRKCDYCHFFVIPHKVDFQEKLLTAMELEIALWEEILTRHDLVSVYFGGGTPSLIGPAGIERLIRLLPLASDVEVTLETNPETVSAASIREFRHTGVNRMSMGVQSFDDSLLNTLSRQHSSKEALQAVDEIAAGGIENLSIDLMYDLPGQTLKEWRRSLEVAADLPIKHLSLYNLTIEPRTVFYKYRDALQKKIPEEEESLAMYELAMDHLPSKGLAQYEISAFAKKGNESLHNRGYWTGRPFLGIGPSAFSYYQGRRFRNHCNLNRYCRDLEQGKHPIDFEEKLVPDAAYRELLSIRLRLLEGVIVKSPPIGSKETLEKLVSDGLLTRLGERFSLTRRGILLYNYVARELI